MAEPKKKKKTDRDIINSATAKKRKIVESRYGAHNVGKMAEAHTEGGVPYTVDDLYDRMPQEQKLEHRDRILAKQNEPVYRPGPEPAPPGRKFDGLAGEEYAQLDYLLWKQKQASERQGSGGSSISIPSWTDTPMRPHRPTQAEPPAGVNPDTAHGMAWPEYWAKYGRR